MFCSLNVVLHDPQWPLKNCKLRNTFFVYYKLTEIIGQQTLSSSRSQVVTIFCLSFLVTA